MNSAGKILLRYIFSAAGIALALLLANMAVFIGWGLSSKVEDIGWPQSYRIPKISDSLVQQNAEYGMQEDIQAEVTEQFAWAMLIDTEGTIVWQLDLPKALQRKYTLNDVAGFSRWYLQDYPVYVWRRDDGLLVLGKPKGSVWKYGIEATEAEIAKVPGRAVMFFVLNGVFSLLLALLMGTRFFRSMKPLVEGIDQMPSNAVTQIPVKGALGELSAKINETSEKLRAQEKTLKKRDKARADWIAAVSHDIRTPLSMIMGYANQMEETSDIPEDTRKQARIIRNQSERIKALINDMNLASKLEYDMQPVKKTRVSMAALIRDVAAEMMNGDLSKKYQFDIYIDSKAQRCAVAADEALMRRAVLNLVGNSIRHNPDGCSITIRLAKEDSTCLIVVQDDGKGYPESALKPA
ncbi:MAG: HAMP domain-containing sensor histidine kinase, partial [Eubacteriales bacterium]